jgi:hypothetical protein
MNPSRNVRLFGTEESAGEMTMLSAGALEATLDAGNLRYIKVGGTEAMRAISFLSRDRNWGTYSPDISNLQVIREPDKFTVTYEALCQDEQQSFRYAARIEGRADGLLSFEVDGAALTDFVTNRTGFVVLHPAGVAGSPLSVEHTDGRLESSRFPELIDPACPFMDIRALTHEVAPGIRVACRMEGDAFEMEDQRNWMDASYKTYVRPLAMPWPYTLEAGEKLSQSVTLKVEGMLPVARRTVGASEPVTISVGVATGRSIPRVGLAVPGDRAAEAVANAELVRRARPSFLVCSFDLRRGDDAETMRRFAELGAAIGAELVLEAIVPCLDQSGKPTDDLDIMRRDMQAIRAAASAGGATFARVAVSPACDLKSTLPGSVFPKAPDWRDLIAATRDAFPNVPVGGGMFSYFTELNRKRPRAGVLDFIGHTGLPLVHAGDDISMIESLEAAPSIFASVKAFAAGAPYWIFPTAISMRANPYGTGPAQNPKNIRQAMNATDPRERGLIGAAWYAGFLARAAAAGVEAVTLAAASGPSSIVYSKQAHAQPWFDEVKRAVFPHYHVIARHAALQGNLLAAASSDAGKVLALAARTTTGTEVHLVNLTGADQTVRIEGLSGKADALILDETTFEAACRDPDWRRNAPRAAIDGGHLTLAPYAVAEIRFS